MSFQDLPSGRGIGSQRGYKNGKQDPIQAVYSGLFHLNTAVSTFQHLVNTLGTPKDTSERREKLHKTRLHIWNLVKDTSAELKQASEADHSIEVSASRKRTVDILAKDFQVVLKQFQKAQRLAAERDTAYTPFVSQSVRPSRQEVLLLDDENFNVAVIEEKGIQEIQQRIGEVNELFKDLAVLVHDQGTMIDDIRVAHAATAQGISHLIKASKTQRSNSSLSCLLLVIFGIVLLIVVIVLVA